MGAGCARLPIVISVSVIRYQVLVDGEGLALVGNDIVAYAAGRELGRGGWVRDERIEDLLARYTPVTLIPYLDFSYTDPAVRRYEIHLRDEVMPSEAGGIICTDGAEGIWSARRVHEGSLERWAIHIPPDLTGADPVREARLIEAIGTLLDDLCAGRERALPLVQEVDNVFGAERPLPKSRYGPVRLADWLRAHPVG